jgi:hypothetical protein
MITTAPSRNSTAEHARLAQATVRAEDDLFEANPWYEWGPYLSERAWGTVREDYSDNGDGWSFFPHDHARSRAYRWNEDGMAGLSDIRHDLCLSLALWNGVDPIVKERMFGLTGPQGNHGEDVKEYWWYLDGLPSHAWLRWRYHYPQGPFPYRWLIDENARRSRDEPEFELIDTGIFDHGRYWAVDVAYAKASPTEILAKIMIKNHASEEAILSVLPTLWFRNTWRITGGEVPALFLDGEGITVDHPRLAGYRLDAAPTADGRRPQALFCDNETNNPRLFGAAPITDYPKDGINDYVITGANTVNPEQRGTKASWWYKIKVPAGGEVELDRQILDWRMRGTGDSQRGLVSIVPPDQLVQIFATLFDEEAFLSPHGLRSISKRRSHCGGPGTNALGRPAGTHLESQRSDEEHRCSTHRR